MAKMDKYEEMADKIVGLAGGKDNIAAYQHCITRLRFDVRDKGKVDAEAIGKLPGSLGTNWSGNQLQVIIGQAVDDVYKLIAEKNGLATSATIGDDGAAPADGEKQRFSVMTVFQAIAGSVMPIIPVLIGAGMFNVVILLIEQLGLMSADNPTMVFLSAVQNAGFYFLPIYVGFSAARYFHANEALGMLMGGMLLAPNFVAAVAAGAQLEFFGLAVPMNNYSSGLIPVLLSVFVMSYVQRFFAKISPDVLRSVIEPLGTIIVMIPAMFFVLGPIGDVISGYLSAALVWIYGTFGFVGVGVLGAAYPWIIMTGLHHMLGPVLINSFATIGSESLIFPSQFVAVINQGAACLGVMIKSKDTTVKSTAGSSAATALLGGITEPALYGVSLRYMTPMYAATAGGFVGGCVAGLGHATANALSLNLGLIGGLPAFLGGDPMNIVWMIAGLATGFATTLVLTLVLYKPEDEEAAEPEATVEPAVTPQAA